jgi:hypothetical protein
MCVLAGEVVAVVEVSVRSGCFGGTFLVSGGEREPVDMTLVEIFNSSRPLSGVVAGVVTTV